MLKETALLMTPPCRTWALPEAAPAPTRATTWGRWPQRDAWQSVTPGNVRALEQRLGTGTELRRDRSNCAEHM